MAFLALLMGKIHQLVFLCLDPEGRGAVIGHLNICPQGLAGIEKDGVHPEQAGFVADKAAADNAAAALVPVFLNQPREIGDVVIGINSNGNG